MSDSAREVVPLRTDGDIVSARHAVRKAAMQLGFSLVDQTKIVTAASELARNTLAHGGGGSVVIESLNDAPRRGIRLEFADSGPGIHDVDRALTDGYTTRDGMGLGLGVARRLMHEFSVTSTPGQGTRVTVVRWR
jgi:serine/threonine-protein kinase RsbT